MVGTVELDDLLALVADRAVAAEQARRLDDDVVAGLAAVGLNRMLLPAALGGAESDPRAVVEVVARLAAVDGSTGWCAAVSIPCNLFSGYITESAAREMYIDPDVAAAGMFAPLGVVTVAARPGGEAAPTLNGRWPFTSNCLHSRWVALGAVVRDEHGTVERRPRLVLVGSEELVIEDTWHATGLQATGSHHVRAEDVPIELARSCTFADRAWAGGPLWRMPMFTVLGPVLGAAPLGIARGAVDEVLRLIREGVGGLRRGLLINDPAGMAELAAADSALRAAHAGVLHVLGEVWAAAVQGERAGRCLQARVLLAVHHAVDTSVEVTSTVHRLVGGAAAYTGHPLLRALHDIHAARQHFAFAHQHRPALMRIVAGADETLPPFVI